MDTSCASLSLSLSALLVLSASQLVFNTTPPKTHTHLIFFRCPPCQSFSPRLKEFYQHVKTDIEIIYISSDRAVPDFEAYFATMPWLSLPPAAVGTAQIKTQLATLCQITGIPALLVLERATGHFITNDARNHVEQWKSRGGDKEAAEQVVQQWLDTPAVPLEEANLGTAGPSGMMGIFSMIAKNPAMIFGLIYIIKYLWRELKKYMPEEEVEVAPAIEQAAQAVAEESEF